MLEAKTQSGGRKLLIDKKKRSARLLHYAFRAKKALIVSLLITLISVGADLLAPYLIAEILDKELIEGKGVRAWPIFAALLIAYFLFTLLASFTRYHADIHAQKAATKITAYIRDDVFSHIQRLPIAYFDQLPAGKVVSRITNDTKTLQNLYRIIISDLTMATAYILIAYLTLLRLKWQLALILLLPLLILYFVIWDYRNKSAAFSGSYRKALGELNANVNENLSNMEVIRALAAEEASEKRFAGINKDLWSYNMKLTVLDSYSSYNAVGTLRYVTIAIVLIAFGFSALHGSSLLTVGLLFLFIDYITKIFMRTLDLSMQLGQLERAYSAADHVFELLNVPVEENSAADYAGSAEVSDGAAEVSDGAAEVSDHIDISDATVQKKAVICFDRVNFSYVDHVPVLKDLSFCVEKGQTLAIVGESGSGKSTIMNLMLRFYDPDSGRILLHGRDLTAMNRAEVRKPIAIVQQETYLFTGTVLDNICLSKPGIGPDAALRALKEVGGSFFLDRHPEGLLTPVTQNGQNFSSGERQLLAFARALAQEPEILILDEATSHVDSETEEIIQRGILRLLDGRTTLMIAHRLSTIRHADMILVLDRGKIVERGKHQELMDHNALYARMVHSQRLGKA